MDASITLPDGSRLRLDATCRPCSAGWLHRAEVDRPVTVLEAVAIAGPRHAAVVVEHTAQLLSHLVACRDDAEQDAGHGVAPRLAERLEAAELRLGAELDVATALLSQRTAA